MVKAKGQIVSAPASKDYVKPGVQFNNNNNWIK
jgi:hypothetical protein